MKNIKNQFFIAWLAKIDSIVLLGQHIAFIYLF